MSPAAPNDEEVHVLQVDGAARRSRLPAILGVGLVLVLAAVGAWLALDPALLDGLLGGPAAAVAPSPAADNLLGAAWSFETTEASSASSAWRVPEEAPAGFEFVAGAAVSGELGARALGAGQAGADGGLSFCRLLSEKAFPLGAHRGAVELSGQSAGEGLQLWLRFEAPRRRPIDRVLASGQGALSGRTLVPPGYTTVRAGISALGPASVDDLQLRFVEATGETEQLQRRGLFDVLAAEPDLLIFRGDELALQVHGLTARLNSGALLPPGVGWLPNTRQMQLADGTLCARTAQISSDSRLLSLDETLTGLPEGAQLVQSFVVCGALAAEPVGVVSARGLQSFTGDFRLDGVRGLAFGRTQDRLALDWGEEAQLSGTWLSEGVVVLRAERPAQATAERHLTLQTSFQEERVAAAQHRDAAVEAERAGRLGQALLEAELVVTRYPHDEEVTATALALRARVQSSLRERFEQIDDDLDDALFLQSAARCREVLRDCEAAAAAYAGSEAEALFRERAEAVARGAAALLEADRRRRAASLEAVLVSFQRAGGYSTVVAELEDYLSRHLAPPAAGGQP
ncbi:MAG: hypothetical protein ACT4PU_13540 [Planctomycetota bacterium]